MVFLSEYLKYPYKDQKWMVVICRNPDQFEGTLDEWRKVHYEIFNVQTDKNIEEIKQALRKKYIEVFG